MLRHRSYLLWHALRTSRILLCSLYLSQRGVSKKIPAPSGAEHTGWGGYQICFESNSLRMQPMQPKGSAPIQTALIRGLVEDQAFPLTYSAASAVCPLLPVPHPLPVSPSHRNRRAPLSVRSGSPPAGKRRAQTPPPPDLRPHSGASQSQSVVLQCLICTDLVHRKHFHLGTSLRAP